MSVKIQQDIDKLLNFTAFGKDQGFQKAFEVFEPIMNTKAGKSAIEDIYSASKNILKSTPKAIENAINDLCKELEYKMKDQVFHIEGMPLKTTPESFQASKREMIQFAQKGWVNPFRQEAALEVAQLIAEKTGTDKELAMARLTIKDLNTGLTNLAANVMHRHNVSEQGIKVYMNNPPVLEQNPQRAEIKMIKNDVSVFQEMEQYFKFNDQAKVYDTFKNLVDSDFGKKKLEEFKVSNDPDKFLSTISSRLDGQVKFLQSPQNDIDRGKDTSKGM